MDDYGPVGLRLAQAFNNAEGDDGEIAFMIRNLFDEERQEFGNDRIFDRRGCLEVRLAGP